ncbi:MAG TPA: MBL fold metallo-hydrolase [Chitinophagaceae bacterium]|nr:MBL fold metallo-hydrolase [Chitinophagaceae bacterium]
MKIIPLSEGAFTVDKSKQFVPFNKDTDDLQQRTKGSLLVEIQPFAIISSKDIIVIDTGLGFSYTDNTLQIHNNLVKEGINPMEVTKVLLSHLHKDHAGGISRVDKITGQRVFSFPNATYYINEKELAFGLEKGSPSFSTDEFVILKNSDNVVLINNNGLIDNYIRYELTGAHSPFHQVFWIEEGNTKAFFGGDVAPQFIQMKTKFVAKYDFDGKKSMELRQLWWQQGKSEGWTFLFYHDIKTPIFSF